MNYESVSSVSIEFADDALLVEASDTVSIQVGVGGTSVNVRVQDTSQASSTLSIYPLDTVISVHINY